MSVQACINVNESEQEQTRVIMSEDVEIDVEVDAIGLRCPEPLMLVRNKMMDMSSGQVIKIIATDPSTSWDFPNFCKFLHHEMVDHKKDADVYHYWIRKG
jgi:tRNA 2-thiouridine synthesizing protein A